MVGRFCVSAIETKITYQNPDSKHAFDFLCKLFFIAELNFKAKCSFANTNHPRLQDWKRKVSEIHC